jgi:hypothetical protein
MCWNAEVSLNTFIFSFFVLILVYYNNEYTKYKIKIFENKWFYIFLSSIIFIQFFEFFIWKNLKNKYNSFFTKCLIFLIILQPIFSLMLLSNLTLRNILLIPYVIVGFAFMLNILTSNKVNTHVSKNGHLVWNYFEIKFGGFLLNKILFLLWTFLLLFPLFYEKKWEFLLFGIITLIFCVYAEYNSRASTWCWITNLFSIYLIVYLLFYLPLKEKGIC